jgi:hypothetical protein
MLAALKQVIRPEQEREWRALNDMKSSKSRECVSRTESTGSLVDFGAYYYLWYDEAQWRNFGLIHSPQLGLYSSSDPKIVAQHIDWSKRHGIKFFVVSWAGKEGLDHIPQKSDQNLRNNLLPKALSSEREKRLESCRCVPTIGDVSSKE